MKFDAIVCGGAGQGIISMAKVMVKAAVKEGYDAKSVAYFGIAITEGPVSAHVRLGSPAGPSPKIRKGTADAIIALDLFEAMKVAHYLAPGGMVMVSDQGLTPVSSRLGELPYPTREQAEEIFAQADLRWVPTHELAIKAGSHKLGGAVMLGAFSAMKPVLDRDHLVLALRDTHPGLADMEAEAFFSGYSFVTGKEI